MGPERSDGVNRLINKCPGSSRNNSKLDKSQISGPLNPESGDSTQPSSSLPSLCIPFWLSTGWLSEYKISVQNQPHPFTEIETLSFGYDTHELELECTEVHRVVAIITFLDHRPRSTAESRSPVDLGQSHNTGFDVDDLPNP
jgi:hypothetical protein